MREIIRASFVIGRRDLTAIIFFQGLHPVSAWPAFPGDRCSRCG